MGGIGKVWFDFMTNRDIFPSGFQEFCSENLARTIQRAFPSLFSDLDQLREEIDKVIFPRIYWLLYRKCYSDTSGYSCIGRGKADSYYGNAALSLGL